MVFLKLSFLFEVYLIYNVVLVFAVPNGIFFKQKQKETILNFILNGKKTLLPKATLKKNNNKQEAPHIPDFKLTLYSN